MYTYVKKKKKKKKKKKNMCALLSITEYVLMFEGRLIDRVCRWEFVCELPGIPQALYSFCLISCERDE